MTEAKTDTCTRCGQYGHTASSCKRWQCIECRSFSMTRSGKIECAKSPKWWSPSPTWWRDCAKATQAAAGVVLKRRTAWREMGSVAT